jgi:hypothetical protein
VQIEIAVEAHYEECAVDVRDQRFSVARRVDAMELRVRREPVTDPPLALSIGCNEDPIADDDWGKASERGRRTRLSDSAPS